ncbi:hypothetical protein ACFQMB_07190 [Pseudobowmanella zhangzhouensis]
MLKFTDEQIAFQEVPNEVSLAFTIAAARSGVKAVTAVIAGTVNKAPA